MLYHIYRSVTSISAPILNNLLKTRLVQGKEDAARLPERRGIASLSRPQGKVMWIHGASVGESLSMLPLLDTLQARLPDWHFLVTTGTLTSARLMAERLPDGAFHQFIPLDHPKWAKRFVDHWQPDAVLWLESELWPNFLNDIATRHIPAALINARMSPKTIKNWKKSKKLAARLLGTFQLILTGAPDYVDHFKAFGGSNVQYVGNLKFGAKALPVNDAALAQMKHAIQGRPCIGFLQTQPTEEALAADVWRHLNQTLQDIQPNMLAIVVPRNNRRGQDVKKELAARGYNVALRTANDAITPETNIYVADTIGEMGLWYSLCPIAVIGGSFVPHGGQNPIEGMHFGTAILYGPHMFNFPAICKIVEEKGVTLPVQSVPELIGTITDLYRHPDKLNGVRLSALALAGQNDAILDSFADTIIEQLIVAPST